MQFDVRRFDVYRKVPKDLTEPTLTGAVISICSCLFIVFLLLSEFYSFINTEIVSELFVDNPTENDRLDVKLNITLPRMKCEHLGLDIQDEMGRHEVGFQENTHTEEMNHGGTCTIHLFVLTDATCITLCTVYPSFPATDIFAHPPM